MTPATVVEAAHSNSGADAGEVSVLFDVCERVAVRWS